MHIAILAKSKTYNPPMLTKVKTNNVWPIWPVFQLIFFLRIYRQIEFIKHPDLFVICFSATIIGGVDKMTQAIMLAKKPHIIIGKHFCKIPDLIITKKP